MSKVLVVVDMQNDFIDGSLGTDEAKSIVKNVINEIKDKKEEGYIVLATQDTHQDDYLSSFEGQNLPVEHCIENTEGWEIQKNIKSLLNPEDIVTKKTFGSEDLVKRIKDINPSKIELLGLCTDICVVSNALMLRAAFPNIPIIIKKDCCAGVTPDLHDAALKTMESCQLTIQ